MAHVVINDYPQHQRTDLFFTTSDFEALDEVWTTEDKLLSDLQTNVYFQGRLRWCDLEPFHFRIMITKTLQQIGGLTAEERADSENPYIKSAHFLICGLIRSLEARSDSSIEFLKLQRVGEYDVSVEFQAVMQMNLPTTRKPGISIVVDNS